MNDLTLWDRIRIFLTQPPDKEKFWDPIQQKVLGSDQLTLSDFTTEAFMKIALLLILVSMLVGAMGFKEGRKLGGWGAIIALISMAIRLTYGK